MNDQAPQATLWPGAIDEARTMSGFGERMQREREMRSISLDEIAESTKISSRMLRALEEEDFEKLPGGIFNKGFVRAYAKFLGIDEEQAVSDFMAAMQEKQQKQAANGNGLHSYSEVLASVEAADDSKPEPDQAAGFMRAAIIIIFVLGIGGLGWRYFTGRPSTTQTVAAQSQPSPASIALNQSAPKPSTAKVETPSVSTAPATSVPASTTPASDIAGTAVPPESAAPEVDVPIRLQIHARETSWVRVTADEKVLLSAEIPAGQDRSFRATKALIVKLGNAPGVELSYNGKAIPPFTDDQKTRTLTFTPEGILQ